MWDRIADGRTDLVSDYVAAGHAATATDAQGVSLLKWCAYYGDVAAIKFLLAQGEKLIGLGENLDLNGAAFHGHWRLCEFLIEQGARATVALTDTGETPLHAAVSKPERASTLPVVQVLLAAGADPNAKTKPQEASGCFMRDVRTRGETPLHRAAAYGSAEVIEALLSAGALKEARDANGDSPLSWASWHLRSAAILNRLCFGPHKIHPDAVAAAERDPAGDRRGSMERQLLGKPHLP